MKLRDEIERRRQERESCRQEIEKKNRWLRDGYKRQPNTVQGAWRRSNSGAWKRS